MKTDTQKDTKKTKTEAKSKSKAPAKEKQKSPEEKNVPYKKLPSLLKKSYTEKQLEKKLLKKIYIDADRNFIKGYFVKNGKNKKNLDLYEIPQTSLFTKKELRNLSTIAKEIKRQKSRIRWIPLLAVIIFISAVVVTLTLTKNIILKKGIQTVCENTFEAKCDISSVNLNFFDSTFNLKGLQIANKAEPMKNLVSVESVVFDFDLLQLLKARLVANELSITGVATNTDRTTSGDISAQRKAKIAKKKAKKAEKEAKENENNPLVASLNEKSEKAMDTLKESVNGIFDQYNPQAIVENCYKQMQTPEVAKKIEAEAKEKVTKYQKKPEEIGAKVSELQKTAETISKIDINSLKNDVTAIKETITTLNNAYTNVQKVKDETDKLMNELQKDVNSVNSMSKELSNAVNHDKNLVSKEIDKISSLNISDGKRFISGTFDNIAYQVLGKYYPYVKKATDYLSNAKNNNKKQDEEKASASNKKSTVKDRYDGRTVYYKNDSAPKIWIKKAAGSGPNFSFDALDITNDMDKTGKPATGNVKISFDKIDHSAKLTVDTRSESKAPLVAANYNCDKLPLNYPTSKFGDAPGVPGVETNSNLNFLLNLYENDGFDITGSGNFTNMKLVTVPFEPEFASQIYSNTLAKINSMKLSVKAGYTLSDGLTMNLSSDADKQFISALSKEMTNQLSSIKAGAETELFGKINEISNGALGEINSFDDIKGKLNGYVDYVNNLSNQLDKKKKEAENALTNSAKKAASAATDKVKDNAKDKLNSLLKR